LGSIDPDATEFRKGSARIALEVEPGFKQFLFIEQNKNRVAELEILKNDYPSKAGQISIMHGEANTALKRWCDSINWRKTRAVVFLDPYGMQVEWSLLEVLANTKGIDLWLLFPLGVGVMRILTKNHPPPVEWSSRITKLFGNEDWKEKFYSVPPENDLFGLVPSPQRKADFKQVADYLVDRLETIFAGVQKTPFVLWNSRNSPLYLLTFAAGNEKGATIALKIANHLLKE
jgi:three-Cys-motif partner protein